MVLPSGKVCVSVCVLVCVCVSVLDVYGADKLCVFVRSVGTFNHTPSITGVSISIKIASTAGFDPRHLNCLLCFCMKSGNEDHYATGATPIRPYALTHRGLRVTILSAHGEVEPEGVAVDDVDVARLRAAEGVDSAAERTVRVHVHNDAGVLAMDGN